MGQESVCAHMKEVGNISLMFDLKSEYVNISNGKRLTFPSSRNKKNSTKIHIIGKSWIYGYWCSDEYTIPSMMQKIMDQYEIDGIVINHGKPGISEKQIADYLLHLDTCEAKEDIFVMVHMFNDYRNFYNKKVADEQDFIIKLNSDRPVDYGEIWVDSGHIGEDGSELLAKQIVDSIFVNNMPTVPKKFTNKFNSMAGRKIYRYPYISQENIWCGMPEFKQYTEYLQGYKQKIGSIVMNCNPFTLGHRYLIEEAASLCDKLYIFVVEEDRSDFPFDDRLMLVQQGTNDLENVEVLYSGNFIISALTFPGYFNKSVNNNVKVDTSGDITLFAKSIAPVLGINVRIVGEEPFDMITKQYNECMSELLPGYGIEFIEIKRKEFGGKAISASRVRKLLSEENFEEIKELVPETTFEYLKRNKENRNDGNTHI